MEARWRPDGRDVLPPVVIAVVQLVGGHSANRDMLRNHTGVHALDAFGYALLAAGPLVLILRRAHPWPVFAAQLVFALAYLLSGYGYGPIFVSLIVGFATAAVRGPRWQTYPLVPVGYLLMVWPALGVPVRLSGSWPALGLAAWLTVLVAAAEGLRQRRAVLRSRCQRAEAARRNAAAERAREEAEREQRATRERLAIARELHDVLAHSLSLINVQSSVALELLDRKPEQAATALAAIKGVSRDALGEMHALLRSLRSGAEPAAPTSPTVGIADLDALLAPARAAGLEVRAIVHGTAHRLPSVVEVAAARIVQESLTNAIRHAPGAKAVVTVRYSSEGLRLSIDNTPPTGSPRHTPAAGGNGIAGMRERAHALRGELHAGPLPDGGFRVDARLPAPTPRQSG